MKNKQIVIVNAYLLFYLILLFLELSYVFIALSPYGNSNKNLQDFYRKIQVNLDINFSLMFMFLIILSLYFPGIGWLAFIVTLWRVAGYCCSKENFGDGFNYGWARYYPDTTTYYNEPLLDKTACSYNGAKGDKSCLKTFEALNRPRPLYATSTLAKEMNIA